MRKILPITAILLIFIFGAALVFVILPTKTTPDLGFRIIDRYQPGNTMDYSCPVPTGMYHIGDTIAVCTTGGWENWLSVSWDTKTKKILTASYPEYDYNKNISDFILAWGIPTSYRINGGVAYIYFGANRFIWVLQNSFSPNSQVWYVEYSIDNNDPVKAWNGFNLK